MTVAVARRRLSPAAKRPRKPKRILVYVSFELERDSLPSKPELDAAFYGAVNGVAKVGEHYYAGKLGAKFTRIP